MTSGDNKLFKGLGLYRGDACFDSGRPSLLPFWVDDITESECFYKSDSILGAVPAAGGYMAGKVVAGAGQTFGQGLLSSLGLPVLDPTTVTMFGLAALGFVAYLAVKR